jgi:hypothetical protein
MIGIYFIIVGRHLLEQVGKMNQKGNKNGLLERLRIIVVGYSVCFCAEALLWILSSVMFDGSNDLKSNLIVGSYLACDVVCLLLILYMFRGAIAEQHASYTRSHTRGSIIANANSSEMSKSPTNKKDNKNTSTASKKLSVSLGGESKVDSLISDSKRDSTTTPRAKSSLSLDAASVDTGDIKINVINTTSSPDPAPSASSVSSSSVPSALVHQGSLLDTVKATSLSSSQVTVLGNDTAPINFASQSTSSAPASSSMPEASSIPLSEQPIFALSLSPQPILVLAESASISTTSSSSSASASSSSSASASSSESASSSSSASTTIEIPSAPSEEIPSAPSDDIPPAPSSSI